jgi:hypothetical protein
MIVENILIATVAIFVMGTITIVVSKLVKDGFFKV